MLSLLKHVPPSLVEVNPSSGDCMCRAHDEQGTVSSCRLLLGEESIVWWLRACQGPSMRLGCFTTVEESVG